MTHVVHLYNKNHPLGLCVWLQSNSCTDILNVLHISYSNSTTEQMSRLPLAKRFSAPFFASPDSSSSSDNIVPEHEEELRQTERCFENAPSDVSYSSRDPYPSSSSSSSSCSSYRSVPTSSTPLSSSLSYMSQPNKRQMARMPTTQTPPSPQVVGSVTNNNGSNEFYNVVCELGHESDPEIFNASFSDFMFCKEKDHRCLALMHHYTLPRRTGGGASSSSSSGGGAGDTLSCGMCLKPEFRIEYDINKALQQPAISLQEAKIGWMKSMGFVDVKGVMQHKPVVTASEEEHTAQRVAERAAWIQYLMAAYAQSEQRKQAYLMSQTSTQNTTASSSSSTNNGQRRSNEFEQFDDDLLFFYNKAQERSKVHSLDSDSDRKHDKICVRYCPVHETTACLIAYKPMKMYRPECMICTKPRTNQRKAVQRDRVSQAGLMSMSSSSSSSS